MYNIRAGAASSAQASSTPAVGEGKDGGGGDGGGVYANRRERGVLFKANKLKQDIKKYVAVYSVAAAYYIRLSLQKFSHFCVLYTTAFFFFFCGNHTLQAARETNIINSSRLSRGGTRLNP